MLENQFINLTYSGNAPLVQGSYSTEIVATGYIRFTQLCSVQAGKKYIARCVSQSSTASVDEWGKSSCLIVATGTVDYDILPNAGVEQIVQWGDIFEVASNASLYIAWGTKEYVQDLVDGVEVDEAQQSFDMEVTSASVDIYPIVSPVLNSRPALPVVLGAAYGLFLPKLPSRIGVLSPDGSVIAEELVSPSAKYVEIFGQAYETQTAFLEWIDTDIAVGDRFFLRVIYQDNTVEMSQPLVRVPITGMNRVAYACDEDAFGFPFHTYGDHTASVYLPILLSKPTYSQKDETYEKMDGEVVTLYAKYYKEWSGETEYLSEEMHDKIIAALSCDYVYINGKRVVKTDNYSPDWENYDLDCDGVTKLARATFKVRENVTQRNSNY